MNSYQYLDALPVTTTGGCLGSFRRLPYTKAHLPPAFPALLDANVHGFNLEFGLIDIKTHYSEMPEDIIERIRTCLEYRDPERLEISADCGLRRVPRYLKLARIPPSPRPPAVCAPAADLLLSRTTQGFTPH
jgi:hypothetical protein